MVISCSATFCTERHQKDGPYTFHRFPHEPLKRKAWLEALKRENFTPTNCSRLCSKHFTPDSFFKSPQGKHNLKHTAVPTIFDTAPLKKVRKVRKDKNTKKPKRVKDKEKKPKTNRKSAANSQKDKPVPRDSDHDQAKHGDSCSKPADLQKDKVVDSDSDSDGPTYNDFDAACSDFEKDEHVREGSYTSKSRSEEFQKSSTTFDEITNTPFNKPCKKRITDEHSVKVRDTGSFENSNKADLLNSKTNSLENLADVCQAVSAYNESENDLMPSGEFHPSGSMESVSPNLSKASGIKRKSVEKGKKSKKKISSKLFGEVRSKRSSKRYIISDDEFDDDDDDSDFEIEPRKSSTFSQSIEKLSSRRGRKKKIIHSSKKRESLRNSRKSDRDVSNQADVSSRRVSVVTRDVYTQTGSDASDAYPVFESVKELKKFIQHKRISYFGDCVPKFDNPAISKRNWEIAVKTVKNCKLEKRRALDKLRRTAVQFERMKESNEILKKKTDMYERLIKSITDGCCKCDCHNILDRFTGPK